MIFSAKKSRHFLLLKPCERCVMLKIDRGKRNSLAVEYRKREEK